MSYNNNGSKNNQKKNSNSKRSSKTSSSSTSSLSWGAKVHTLDTIDAYSASNTASSNANASSSSSSSSSNSPTSSTFKIQHIPNLTSSEYAKSLLERIKNEFQTIVQKRGYNITSVTEMCCCDDGFNYLDGSGEGAAKKRKRKIRKMPNNVLGYNLTHGYRGRGRGSNNTRNSVHRIHLRLRHPTNHNSFYPYEDIAGTMCHELAHCEVGAHNAKFYKLMDEIMEQYSVFLVKGLVLDKNGFPVGSDEAYTLGGGGGNGRGGGRSGNHAAGKAARQRMEQRKKFGLGRGTYVLGGGLSYIQDIKNREDEQRKNGFNIYGNQASSSAAAASSYSSLAKLPPREAARIAAERRVEERRRIDSLFCLPCEEIIEILDESSSDEDEEEGKERGGDALKRNTFDLTESDTKKTSDHIIKTKRRINEQTHNKVIDLVDDSSDDEKDCDDKCQITTDRKTKETAIKKCPYTKVDDKGKSWNCHQCTYTNPSQILSCEICGTKRRHHSRSHSKQDYNEDLCDDISHDAKWICTQCTFAENTEFSLSCTVCGSERSDSIQGTQKQIQKILRQDFIDDVKKKEKEQSLEEFNGFNIYGNDKQSSGTLNHLT